MFRSLARISITFQPAQDHIVRYIILIPSKSVTPSLRVASSRDRSTAKVIIAIDVVWTPPESCLLDHIDITFLTFVVLSRGR